jgi:hypothetical protein
MERFGMIFIYRPGSDKSQKLECVEVDEYGSSTPTDASLNPKHKLKLSTFEKSLPSFIRGGMFERYRDL